MDLYPHAHVSYLWHFVFACTVVCRRCHQRSGANLQFLLSTVESWIQGKAGGVEDPPVNYIPEGSQFTRKCLVLLSVSNLPSACLQSLFPNASRNHSSKHWVSGELFILAVGSALRPHRRMCVYDRMSKRSHQWAVCHMRNNEVTLECYRETFQARVLLCEHLGEKHDSGHMWLQIP